MAMLHYVQMNSCTIFFSREIIKHIVLYSDTTYYNIQMPYSRASTQHYAVLSHITTYAHSHTHTIVAGALHDIHTSGGLF